MQILLQDTETLDYINWKAGWTRNHHEARPFRRGLDALLFAYNTGMPNMVMLFEFTDSRMNFSFPVTNSRGDEIKPNDQQKEEPLWPD